jgi:signal transduction histidine kinase
VSLDLVRPIRPWAVIAVAILTVATALTAFAEDMPTSHHVIVPAAVAVMVAAWAVELTRGARWSRLLLVAATVAANVWMTLVGHLSVNFLFLILMLAWVGALGSRAESACALVLALATVGVAAIVESGNGQIGWSLWASWSVGMLMVWVMALVVAQLRLLRSEAEQRNRELATLLGVSQSVASTLEMTPLLNAVLDALGTVVDSSATTILSLDEGTGVLRFASGRGSSPERRLNYRVEDFGPAWEQLRRDEPVVIAEDVHHLPFDNDQDPAIRSVMWVPLIVRGRITGVVRCTSPAPGAYGARAASLAMAIARQAAVALENARLHERAREAGVLEERQRLARELHDSVTQSLYGISLYAEAAGRALADGEPEPAASNLRDIRETTQEALSEMRLLLFDLRPALLEEHGLAAALRARLHAAQAQGGLITEFDCQGQDRLAADTEHELHRIAQEALNNVLKHAHAQRLRVRLVLTSDSAVLEVADDGVGFEPLLLGGIGFGLRGMRERAERLGGTLEIQSSAGDGTRVRVEVPR